METLSKIKPLYKFKANDVEIGMSDNMGGWVTTKNFNVHEDSDIDGCSFVSIEEN